LEGVPSVDTLKMRKERLWVFILLLLLGGAVTYSNSLSGPFLLDDEYHIERNEDIQSFGNLRGMLGRGRPLDYLTLAFNYNISALNPKSYHAFNIFIHFLAALALFGLVGETLKTAPLKNRFGENASGFGFAIAFLWMIHPLQTQAVNYIIQRSELLMGLLYLLTLFCMSRGANARHSSKWYSLAIASCAFGMTTKEVIVTAPMTALIYDRIFLSNTWKEVFKKRALLHLGLMSTWMILAFILTNLDSATTAETAGFGYGKTSAFDYLLTQPTAILHYLKLAVWPHPLCFDYQWPVVRSASEFMLPLIIVASLLLATLWAHFKRPRVSFLGIWFFFILAPTSSVMPIADALAEHRMYLSLAAIMTLLVLGGHSFLVQFFEHPHKSKHSNSFFMRVVFVLVALPLMAATYARNQDYQSAEFLWKDTAQKRPDNVRAHYNLATALTTNGKLNEAVTHFNRTIELDPKHVEAHRNLGSVLAAQGKIEEGIEHFRSALEIDPDHIWVRNNWAAALIHEERLEEAIKLYKEVVAINSEIAETHFALGSNLAKLGRYEEGLQHLKEVLRLDPNFENLHRNLAVVYRELGDTDAAEKHFKLMQH
jgi:protein O-mannosyl-transferase